MQPSIRTARATSPGAIALFALAYLAALFVIFAPEGTFQSLPATVATPVLR